MSQALRVAFVVGVTPGKWSRVWEERLPDHPLELVPADQVDALDALSSGSADAALVRLPIEDGRLGVIPLYEELAFVVAPKDHPIEVLDSVVLADLDSETVLVQDWSDAVELVAANVGVAIMPQSVSRALSRRDVVARPVTDAPTTRIALAWRLDAQTPLVDEFIGIVRGRTVNSSRGAVDEPAPRPAPRPAKKKPVPKKAAPKFPNRKKG